MNPDGTSRTTVDLSDHEVVLVVKSRQTNRTDIIELEGSRMRLVIETPLDPSWAYSWGIDDSISTALTRSQTLEVRIENVVRYTASKA